MTVDMNVDRQTQTSRVNRKTHILHTMKYEEIWEGGIIIIVILILRRLSCTFQFVPNSE